jgi:hypothetical protein
VCSAARSETSVVERDSRSYDEIVIGLTFLLALFVGIPAVVFASERMRRRRSTAELEDEAVRRARESGEGPGDHEPLAPPLPPPPSF